VTARVGIAPVKTKIGTQQRHPVRSRNPFYTATCYMPVRTRSQSSDLAKTRDNERACRPGRTRGGPAHRGSAHGRFASLAQWLRRRPTSPRTACIFGQHVSVVCQTLCQPPRRSVWHIKGAATQLISPRPSRRSRWWLSIGVRPRWRRRGSDRAKPRATTVNCTSCAKHTHAG